MIEHVHHSAFPQPASPNLAIWRYLTLSKFEWLATEGRLFMPSAAHLGDPLEGTQPRGEGEYWQSLVDHATTDEQRRTIEHNRKLTREFAVAFRTRYYVSCWHINDAINREMWELYAPDGDSVAVRSTAGRLNSALPPYVEVGMVRYIDFRTDRLPTLNMLEHITHKNVVFQHERELRAVAMHPIVEGSDQDHFRAHHFEAENNPEFRVFVPPVSLSDLIEAVLVHPRASTAFIDRVQSLCDGSKLPAPERAAW